jgi:hypothetical protein
MTDPVTDKFGDLDYPGRRRPVNRGPKKAEPEETPVWDAKPVYYMVKGEKQEFFLISHLAKALDYSVQSIRAWEAAGLLPRTPYRSPKTRRPTATGTKGRRLWTREQVEGIIRIAKRHGVIFNKKPPTSVFAREVAHLFQQLVGDHAK